jgi:hypothetical protein
MVNEDDSLKRRPTFQYGLQIIAGSEVLLVPHNWQAAKPALYQAGLENDNAYDKNDGRHLNVDSKPGRMSENLILRKYYYYVRSEEKSIRKIKFVFTEYAESNMW